MTGKKVEYEGIVSPGFRMTRRQAQRYYRLRSEGFTYFEAKGYIDQKITTPIFRRFRRQRVAMLRETRKEGVPKRQLEAQIRAMYKFEGHFAEGKYQPLDFLDRWTEKAKKFEVKKPEVVEAPREVSAGGFYKRCYASLIWHGFVPFEATEFVSELAAIREAQKVKKPKGAKSAEEVWNSEPWKAMRAHRRALILSWKRKGYTNAECRAMIENYYKAKDSSPWDWLKKEYRPKATPRRYDVSMQKIAQRKTDRLLHPVRSKIRQKVMFWD
jgi:hypothetical protein